MANGAFAGWGTYALRIGSSRVATGAKSNAVSPVLWMYARRCHVTLKLGTLETLIARTLHAQTS